MSQPTEAAIPSAKAIPDGKGGLIVPDCPICHQRHHHGKGYGHRIAHCTDLDGLGYILIPE